MKKIVFLCVVALSLTACTKDDKTGIPPLYNLETPGQINPSDENIPTLIASEVTQEVYQVGKKVRLKGVIKMIKAGKSSRPHIILKDGTQIQIYASSEAFKSLSKQTKDKLNKDGQEVTVTGTFTDYKLNSGKVVKEIVYQKESDLVFGEVTTSSDTTNEATDEAEATDDENETTGTTDQEVQVVEASSLKVSDFQENKKVKIHGTIKVVKVGKSSRSAFVLSDGTEIQLYGKNYRNFSKEIKDKLNKEGQGVIVTGKFNTHNGTKQVYYENETDLVFDQTTDTTGTDTTEPTPDNNAGNTETPSANDNTNNNEPKFDFENSGQTPSKSYGTTGTMNHADATLTYKARTDMEGYEINGAGLMLKGDKKGNSYVKITFKDGVKTLSFDYKGAFTGKGKRIFKVVEGDENGTTQLGEQTFTASDSGKFDLTLNKQGSFTLTIVADAKSSQFVIDNIRWTK